MSQPKVPEYVLANLGLNNQREYRQLKRRELRELRRLVKRLLLGCIYMPNYDLMKQLQDLTTDLVESTKVKNWGG